MGSPLYATVKVSLNNFDDHILRKARPIPITCTHTTIAPFITTYMRDVLKNIPTIEAHDGGSPKAHVGFKEWKCPMSLFLQFVCQF